MRQAINVDFRHRGVRYEISSRESLAALARASEMASCRTHGGRFPPEPPFLRHCGSTSTGARASRARKCPQLRVRACHRWEHAPADVQASVTSHGICRRSMSA